MAQQEQKSATPSSLGIQTRSPRSLQTRNTKNLSLDIRDKKVDGAQLESLENIPSVGTRPLVIGQNAVKRSLTGHASKNRRPEASNSPVPIGTRSGSTSPIYSTNIYSASASANKKIGRVHSMSLSVKTGELLPSLSARGRSQTICSALDTSTPAIERPGMEIEKKAWILSNERDDSDENEEILHPDVFKKNAYPRGPLLVIPPNVYLYSEPTLEEVFQFDVVINVAKEVADLGPLIRRQDKPISYYHIPWNHNSRISVDLDHLTDIIHDAVTQDKKVLVHCQCGVSRSASLIVAYIMRFSKMRLNDAYSHLKRIAKDTSPNMGLIFQLIEWNEQRSRHLGPQVEPSNDNSRCGFAIPPPSTINDITLGSPELTPKTPADYFNKLSASSSSTSASSSTIIGNQSHSKPVTISTDLGDFLSTTSAGAASSNDDFWT